MPFYDESIINDILSSTDIIDVIEHYLSLKKRGKNYIARCPFHNEKTPSFTVSPDKQIFYCFGCGAGGNSIHFIRLKENLTFPESIEKLAEICHYELPKVSGKETKQFLHLQDVTDWAREYYKNNLKRNEKNLEIWFQKRKIKPITKEIFQMGYASADWGGLYQKALKDKINIQLLQESGLVMRGRNNQFYDRFRNRIMFPIIGSNGHTIAFGGRTLDKNEKAKYLNSPESQIFHKGDQFFGYFQTQHEIRKKKAVFLVEGYMDLISLYQQGIKNCLSPLGTALTVKQSRILTRITEEIILLFDHDTAGLKASYRATELLLPTGIKTTVVLMEPGTDPDDMINNKGLDYFKEKVMKRQPGIVFRWKYLNQYSNIKNENQKIEEMLSFIYQTEDPIIRDTYLDEISQLLTIRKSVLLEKINAKNKNSQINQKQGLSIKKTKKYLTEEKTLLQLILHNPIPYIEKAKKDIPLTIIRHDSIRRILQTVFDYYLLNQWTEKPNWLSLFNNQEEIDLISEIILNDLEDNHYSVIYQDCVKKLKLRYIEHSLQQVQFQIKVKESQKDEKGLNHLLKRFEQLMVKKREIQTQEQEKKSP